MTMFVEVVRKCDMGPVFEIIIIIIKIECHSHKPNCLVAENSIRPYDICDW